MRSLPLVLLLVACAPAPTDGPADTDPVDTEVVHVVDPDAAARAFRIFYAERVDRALVAWNRYALFGDASSAATIARYDVARTGAEIEVIPGPKDNNPIGTSVLGAWAAWRVFRTDAAELTLIRMLQGSAFTEQVTGVDGLTVREAFPGWTRVMDGVGGTISRQRRGEDVTAGVAPPVDVDDEVLAAFFDGVRVTYQEDPSDFLAWHHPVADTSQFAVTYAFGDDDLIRISDCCSSLKRTPEGRPWAGAWWGNHDSRDNLPDHLLGVMAAKLVAADPDASARLKTAADAAIASGRRIGDLIDAAGGIVQTVDETHAYGTLTPSGQVRPHGFSEGQDLGSLGDCPDVWASVAASTAGLVDPLSPRPIPGTIEPMLQDIGADCPTTPQPACTSLGTAYCGLDWTAFSDLTLFGTPLLEMARNIEAASPGQAAELFGSFQGDVVHIVDAMAAVALDARARGDDARLAEVGAQLQAMDDLVRAMADILYTTASPDQRARQRYEAARLDGLAGLHPPADDLGELALEEARMARLEGLLTGGDTPAWDLVDDDALRARVQGKLDELAASSDPWDQAVHDRYVDAFGDTVPVRREGDAYEARTARGDWQPIPNPHHEQVSGDALFHALPLCVTAPHLLDCTWAVRGCAAVDLDASGTVDEADLAAFEASPSDVDGDGTVGDLDAAFVNAAQGCWYDR
jgi:hypothetical protein